MIGCSALTAPLDARGNAGAADVSALDPDLTPPTLAAGPQIVAQPVAAAVPAADQEERAAPGFKASHIVFEYAGSARHNPKITRSKQAAERLARKVLKEVLSPSADFSTLAKKYSDGESAAQGGLIRARLRKGTADPAIYAAVAALEPGGISGVIESKWGFHILRRIE